MTIDELLAALQAIIDEAAASGEGLTDEQAERYEALEAKLATARRAEEVQKRHAAYKTATPGQYVTGTAPKADDTLERAFNAYLRTGKENSDIVELRTQSTGNTEGGYTVPEGFRQKLVDRMKAFGGIGEVVETITTDSGNNLPWPTIDDTANVGEIVAEGGTFASGADLVFGTADLGAYKYMAGGGGNVPLRVSWELLQDSAFNVEALISNKLGERIARLQAVHLVSGTGSGQPLGIQTGLTGVEMTGAEITYDDLLRVIHSVDPAYRQGGRCRWAFSDTSLAYLRGMKDAAGDPLWRADSENMGTELGGGTLMGYPVTIDQAFAGYTTATNAATNWGVFGDLAEGYVRRQVKDITVVVNPWTRAANGQVEYSAWARMDATQQNVNAYKAISGYTA